MVLKIFLLGSLGALAAARTHPSHDVLSTFTVDHQGVALVQTRATKTVAGAIPIAESEQQEPLEVYAGRQVAHMNGDVSKRMQATDAEYGPHAHGYLSKAAIKKIKSMTVTAWVWGAYHKTGCEFLVSMMASMKHTEADREGTDDLNHVLGNIVDGKKKIFLDGKWDNFFYEPDYEVIKMIPDYRFVHMIRDPVDLVVSAYRYHASCPSGEPWVVEPMTKMFHITQLKEAVKKNIPDIHTKFTAAMEQGKSLCEFYQQKDLAEWEGSMFEAYRCQHQITTMSRNYAAMMYDPNVVQVTTKGVTEDFNATMHCMFEYLGKSRPIHQAHVEETIAPLDVMNKHVTRRDDPHVTTGKYDNEKIIAVVEQIEHVKEARYHMQWDVEHQKSPHCGSL